MMCGVKHKIVAAAQQLVAQPVFDQLANQPALGVPENQSRPGQFLDAEKIQLCAEAAMVAALGLFEFVQVFVELRFFYEARAVNPLHLRIAFVPLPVCAGDIE